jgi:hypothetical protein
MRFTKHLAPGLALCTGLVLSTAGSLYAQPIFQEVFGGGLDDAARGGVLNTSDGGFIAVGESQSFGADRDVYIVKTDRCGKQEWITTYDIGGEDHGRKIRELVDGGYVVVGTTQNTNGSCSSWDAFVMAIDAKGQQIWTKTYGGTQGDEGTDIQLYNGGKELIVSGHTSSFGPGGKVDGWLMRLDLTGNQIWSRTYGTINDLDLFNSLAALSDGTGDIVAVGGTRSFPGGEQIYAVRVDQNGDLVWSYNYGNDAIEVGHTIIETSKGELMVVGYTTEATNSADGYILRLRSDGTYLDDRIYIATKDPLHDELRDIKELKDGNFIVTGTYEKAPNGFGGQDVFIMEINPTLNRVWAGLYGGGRDDQGWAIVVTYETRTPTFTIAGTTQSFGFGQQDLYLIRSLAGPKSGCNDAETKVEEKTPKFVERDAPIWTAYALVQCEAKTSYQYNENAEFLCQDCPRLPAENEAEDEDLTMNH